jgi:hypothetical protein
MVQAWNWPERGVGWQQDGSRSRRAVIECAMQPDGVLMVAPALDPQLSLVEHENLSLEQFVAQLAVEALDISVLPGAAGSI